MRASRTDPGAQVEKCVRPGSESVFCDSAEHAQQRSDTAQRLEAETEAEKQRRQSRKLAEREAQRREREVALLQFKDDRMSVSERRASRVGAPAREPPPSGGGKQEEGQHA